jgi:hypothetical protein
MLKMDLGRRYKKVIATKLSQERQRSNYHLQNVRGREIHQAGSCGTAAPNVIPHQHGIYVLVEPSFHDLCVAGLILTF